MRILDNPSKVAIIDPNKKRGQDGQYVSYEGERLGDVMPALANYVANGFEVRLYYYPPTTDDGESIPLKVIVTTIPPGHIQPFHTHIKIHEVSIVNKGLIAFIDDPNLMDTSDGASRDLDKDRQTIMEKATYVRECGCITTTPGTRHTVANFTNEPAEFITLQTIRTDLVLETDWI